MIWTLEWGPVARRDFLTLPLHTAERLDAAVILFAATNRGNVHLVSRHDPRRLQLLVPGAIGYMFADHESGLLLVTRAFTRR